MLVWLFFLSPSPPLPYTMSKNEIGCGLGEYFIAKRTIKLILKTTDSETVELLETHTNSSRLAIYLL